MPSKKEMAALQAKHDALESKVNALTKDLAAANKAKASAVTQVTSLESELKTSRADASKLRGDPSWRYLHCDSDANHFRAVAIKLAFTPSPSTITMSPCILSPSTIKT